MAQNRTTWEKKKKENFLGKINSSVDGSHCSNYKCTSLAKNAHFWTWRSVLDSIVSRQLVSLRSSLQKFQLFYEGTPAGGQIHLALHLALPAYTTSTHSIQAIYISKCKSSSSPLTFLGQHQTENQDSSKSHPHSIHSMAGKRTGF